MALGEDARAGKESKSAAFLAVQGTWHACLASRSDRRPSCGPLCRSMELAIHVPAHPLTYAWKARPGRDGAAPVQGGLNPPPWITHHCRAGRC